MLKGVLQAARSAGSQLAQTPTTTRNDVLHIMDGLISRNVDRILEANHQDQKRSQALEVSASRLSRLGLSAQKLALLQEGLRTVSRLPDPLGQGRRWTIPNGLILEEIRVPLGVIGLIYESRPGVTIEAVSLAIKSGNAMILRGGREAQESNQVLADLWRQALLEANLPKDGVQLLNDPDRSLARELMHLEGLDLLIPRGGASLIQTVVKEASVPVVETGVGNCHLYVNREADLDMALHILKDGKLGNPAVCNALETLLVDDAIAEAFLPQAHAILAPHQVVWHGDQKTCQILGDSVPADDTDWSEEYLDLHLACRVVPSPQEAINHIRRYGSGHSESIVTNNYAVGQDFLSSVDAAVVYWNASTRFTDGHQFGLGAEVGISTQKLHARGPMGLNALTTTKTLAYGSGQTRDL